MAMTSCQECNEQVSADAKHCIHCGAPRPDQTNYVVNLVLLAMLMVIGLAAVAAWHKVIMKKMQGGKESDRSHQVAPANWNQSAH